MLRSTQEFEQFAIAARDGAFARVLDFSFVDASRVVRQP